MNQSHIRTSLHELSPSFNFTHLCVILAQRTMSDLPTVILVPGNGCTNISKANWYVSDATHVYSFELLSSLPNSYTSRRSISFPLVFLEELIRYWWVSKEIKALGFPVKCETFPDPYEAKESVWLPFIHDELANGSDNIILIGHSSGAEASMRYLEKYKVVGAILVSACWTDLDEPSETISGYYGRPWLWQEMVSNSQWILQFGSADDPFIPIEEMRHVASEIGTDYIEYTSHGHFMTKTFPELLEHFKRKVAGSNN